MDLPKIWTLSGRSALEGMVLACDRLEVFRDSVRFSIEPMLESLEDRKDELPEEVVWGREPLANTELLFICSV